MANGACCCPCQSRRPRIAARAIKRSPQAHTRSGLARKHSSVMTSTKRTGYWAAADLEPRACSSAALHFGQPYFLTQSPCAGPRPHALSSLLPATRASAPPLARGPAAKISKMRLDALHAEETPTEPWIALGKRASRRVLRLCSTADPYCSARAQAARACERVRLSLMRLCGREIAFRARGHYACRGLSYTRSASRRGHRIVAPCRPCAYRSSVGSRHAPCQLLHSDPAVPLPEQLDRA